MRAGSRSRSGQGGFTYLMVVALIALLGLALSVVGPRWADETQREREQELLKVGTLYAQAIKSYYEASPGSLKQYPPDLQSLLLDSRFVGVRRHIRRLYADPLQPDRPWGLVRDKDGRVTGIYSQDQRAPLRQAPLSNEWLQLGAASQYSQWVFSPRTNS